jgi:hypothetical protein
MSDPIRTFDYLKSAYLRYFDSPFDLRFEEVVRARGRMLDRDGVLYREPLIEPQPPYASSGHTIGPALRSVLDGNAAWRPDLIADAIGLAEAGLLAPRGGAAFELYTHQLEMLRSTVARSNDAVILTGTGSGKTEAIYLPVVASLARESAGWRALPPTPRNDWWAMAPPGWRRRAVLAIGGITRASRSARMRQVGGCQRCVRSSFIRSTLSPRIRSRVCATP